MLIQQNIPVVEMCFELEVAVNIEKVKLVKIAK